MSRFLESASAAEDPGSFELLIDRYQSVVFAVCLRILGHRQDAEDVTQETFSRFFRYGLRFDTTRPVEPYLKRIAGNRCRTFLARRRRDRSLATVAEPSTDRCNQQRRASQLAEEVNRAINRLPASHRAAFSRFHHRQMSYAEIADELATPVGTIKTWVHRARTQLIDELSRRDAGVHRCSNRSVAGEDTNDRDQARNDR